MSDDLDRLLMLIDEVPYRDDDLVETEARVWSRLQGEISVEPHDRPTPRRRRRAGGPLVLAAALVAVVAGLVAVAVARGNATAPADTPAVVSVPLDRAAACSKYRSVVGGFDLVDDALGGDDALHELDGVVAALDVLRSHFVALGAGDDTLDALDRIRGGVQQARLSLADGDGGAALSAVEFARRTYRSSDLAMDDCLG